MRYTVHTKGHSLHVRSGAGPNFPVVRNLSHGAPAEVVSTSNGWARLSDGGYVAIAYLRHGTHAGTIQHAPPAPSAPAGTALTGLNFATLKANHPGHGTDVPAVKRMIGGQVNNPKYENTCVIRLSRALNNAGVPIPHDPPGLHTVRGADGRNYAMRVHEMRDYLGQRFGQPTMRIRNTQVRQLLAGRQGIIVFDYDHHAEGKATGHVDLWDGQSLHANPAPIGTASRVSFWEIPAALPQSTSSTRDSSLHRDW